MANALNNVLLPWKLSLLPRKLGWSQEKGVSWMPGMSSQLPLQNGDSEQKWNNGKIKLISCASEFVELGSYLLHMEASSRFGRNSPAANIHTAGWLQTLELMPSCLETTCVNCGRTVKQRGGRLLEITADFGSNCGVWWGGAWKSTRECFKPSGQIKGDLQTKENFFLTFSK